MALFEKSALNEGVQTKEVWGWALFDAANSGYSTVVLTAVFNAYFVATVCQNASWATLLWTSAIAASNALAMVLMPTIGRMADITASKKRWLVAATMLCIGATAALALVGAGDMTLAVILVVLSNLGYCIGETLNSAFLPELSRPESVGKVSGWGWSLGYLGGLVTLWLCLTVVLMGQKAGMQESDLVPATNLITAAVFALVSIPLFAWLKERAVPQPGSNRIHAVFSESVRELLSAWKALPQFPDFSWLLLCGFCYQCGIATVITLSAIYASSVMGFGMVETLVMVLVVNITAAVGAFGFGYIQDRIGHKAALGTTLVVWIAMVVCAAMAETVAVFWVAANLAGLAMGSSQSAGRALVAVFAPKQRSAEFYSLWNMALWLSAIVGPMTYGMITWLTGNDQRLAIMVTGLFFVAGLCALLPIQIERGERAAKAHSS